LTVGGTRLRARSQSGWGEVLAINLWTHTLIYYRVPLSQTFTFDSNYLSTIKWVTRVWCMSTFFKSTLWCCWVRGWLFTLPTMVSIAELSATLNTNATELTQPKLPPVESKFTKSCPKPQQFKKQYSKSSMFTTTFYYELTFLTEFISEKV